MAANPKPGAPQDKTKEFIQELEKKGIDVGGMLASMIMPKNDSTKLKVGLIVAFVVTTL